MEKQEVVEVVLREAFPLEVGKAWANLAVAPQEAFLAEVDHPEAFLLGVGKALVNLAVVEEHTAEANPAIDRQEAFLAASRMPRIWGSLARTPFSGTVLVDSL